MNHYHKNLDNTISVSGRRTSALQKPSDVDHHQAYCEAVRQVITKDQLKTLWRENSPLFKAEDLEIKGTNFYCPESSCHAPLKFVLPFNCFVLKKGGRHDRKCSYFWRNSTKKERG